MRCILCPSICKLFKLIVQHEPHLQRIYSIETVSYGFGFTLIYFISTIRHTLALYLDFTILKSIINRECSKNSSDWPNIVCIGHFNGRCWEQVLGWISIWTEHKSTVIFVRKIFDGIPNRESPEIIAQFLR